LKKIKVIFLDIDGVLNSNRYYTAHTPKDLEKRRDKYGDGFCPESSKWLSKLIDDTGSKIVISSTWRFAGLKEMQDMWINRKMSGEVIDVTPSFRAELKDIPIPRGLEIQWYYQEKHRFRHWQWDGKYVQEEKAKCTLENYVIIDDDSDMLYEQRDNFINCNHLEGFLEKEYEQGLKILNTK